MNRILIVDDEAEIRELLKEILREEGYAVSSTASGAEAVVLLRDTPYDVLLLDIWLPDRDGLDVLNDLRSLETEDKPEVIVISGHDKDEQVARCIELGAEDYLSKPIDQFLLHARVNSCLARREIQLRQLEQFFPPEVARKVLADAKPSIDRFLGSGVSELKAKLGPILWQFMHTKKFDPADFEAFLALSGDDGSDTPVRLHKEPPGGVPSTTAPRPGRLAFPRICGYLGEIKRLGR